ncbi:unnamed protein product [Protopolystoma xenopodis]|uniref:Uncharacterized protein n=1 Tax=Protopolystoma xenopodis TaxID=117903 RepID=A0A448XEA2_9PLAT|nr:unnamed protein product [Protopolystoma xenopodis]
MNLVGEARMQTALMLARLFPMAAGTSGFLLSTLAIRAGTEETVVELDEAIDRGREEEFDRETFNEVCGFTK